MREGGNGKTVVGFGMVNHDTVAVVPGYRGDSKVVASALWEQVGGPVPVALMAVARLGAGEVRLVSASAYQDLAGDQVLGWLGEDGVTTELCPRAVGGGTSRALVVIEQDTGGRFVASYGGDPPPIQFTPAQEAVFRGAAALHLDGRDLPAALQAARWTRDGGGVVSFDLGTMRPGRAALFPLCDVIVASAVGGAGAYPDVSDDPEEQVRCFLRDGVQVAGVTLGHRGVVIGSREQEPVHLPAFSVADVVDTCGAGDCFHGAFLWAYLHDYGVVDAAQFAQAAVAHRIRHYGNRAGLPRLDEIKTQ